MQISSPEFGTIALGGSYSSTTTPNILYDTIFTNPFVAPSGGSSLFSLGMGLNNTNQEEWWRFYLR